MAFQPEVNDKLAIGDVEYAIAEHPLARGMPYGQEGRAAVVYLITAADDKRALKVFKPRFRVPGLVALSSKLEAFAGIPGLSVCRRTVITPQQHASLIRENPDLIYSVLMPWIDGPTWMEVLLDERELTPEQSLASARSLAELLATMEEQGLAHCDLSGPNVLIPMLADHPDPAENPVALVDVEQMYGPGLAKPNVVPAGSSGYAHKTAPEGFWGANVDRFAGAVLIAEMLGWCDSAVRATSWGENYFNPDEMQQDTRSYKTLSAALRGRWGDSVARVFDNAWWSDTLADCPTFGEWLAVLPAGSTAGANVAASTGNGHVADTIILPATALAGLTHDQETREIEPVAIANGHDAPTMVVPAVAAMGAAAIPAAGAMSTSAAGAPATTAPPVAAPTTPSAAAAEQAARQATRSGIGWNFIIPIVLVLLIVLGGGFAVLQATSNSSTSSSALATQTAVALLGAGATQTAGAGVNGTQTAIALATRYPGAISAANVGEIHLLGTLKGHTGPVLSVAFSPDGLTIASSSQDGTVRLWRRTDGISLQTLIASADKVNPAPISEVVFSPDGKTVVAASTDKNVTFWNVSDGQVIRNLPGLVDAVRSIAYMLQNNNIVAAAGNVVQVWPPDAPAPSQTWSGHTSPIDSVAVAPDGRTVASGGEDNTVRIWRVADSSAFRILRDNNGAIASISFSPDGVMFATGSKDNTINVYSAKNSALIHKLKAHTSGVRSVAFSPVTHVLASGGEDGTIRLWNLDNGALLRTLQMDKPVNSVAFSPDGATLIAGGDDNNVTLWGTNAAQSIVAPTETVTETTTPTDTPTFAPATQVPADAQTQIAQTQTAQTQTAQGINTATATTTIAAVFTATRTSTPAGGPATNTSVPLTHTPIMTSTSVPPTLTGTHTSVPTVTATLVPPTHTSTVLPLTHTATVTSTPTVTATATVTPTVTPTATVTATITVTPSLVPPTHTPEPQPQDTNTPRPTNTRPVPTDTPVPPIPTDTPVRATNTPRPTNTRPPPPPPPTRGPSEILLDPCGDWRY